MSEPVARRVRRHREGLRASGLRPVQIWAQDSRSAGFAEECERQALVVRDAEDAAAALSDDAWFGTSDKNGWTG
ncbi:MAG TPA: antitoxin MazE family protein [Caulobacteraceae bacterium]|nr:antitoxin MazE family protein [Caulobacteraceae bacterium]